jgi:hypothetical protein
MDKNFKADSLHPKNNFALLIDGYLQIKEDGYYTFIIRAGKGLRAWIDKKLIMQWDDNANGAVFTYLVPLSKGFYPVKMESFIRRKISISCSTTSRRSCLLPVMLYRCLLIWNMVMMKINVDREAW